jgi:hypothetical protein
MKRTLAAVGAVLGVVLGLAGPAGAITGDQEFVILFDDEESTVIANGPISGVGEDIEDAENQASTFVFPEGDVFLTHPETDSSEDFNEIACVGTFESTGTYDITGGTDEYLGADGSGTYQVHGVFILDRTDEGCSEEGGHFFAVVHASGTTTLP